MPQIEILKRNVNLTPAQVNTARNNQMLSRGKVPNLRFGRLGIASDADVD